MAGALPTLILILLAALSTPATPEGAAAGPVPTAPVAPAAAIPSPADPPIVLTWSAPDGCPGLDELRAEIGRLAGPVPAPAEQPEAHAVVRRGPKDGWLLTLTTRAGTLAGERKLAAADCSELMRATALVLALMLNPSAGAPPEPAPPRPAPPPVVIVALPPPPPPALPPSPRFRAGVEALLGTGVLPGGAAPGIGVRLGWGRGHFEVEIRGEAWLGRSTVSPSDSSTGGSFDVVDLGAGGCAIARRDRRVAPSLCIGASVTRAHGAGYGVSDPGAATAWWTGGYAEGDVRIRLTPRNAARIGVGATLPFGRPTFALAGVGSVWQPAAFGARGMLGWELDF